MFYYVLCVTVNTYTGSCGGVIFEDDSSKWCTATGRGMDAGWKSGPTQLFFTKKALQVVLLALRYEPLMVIPSRLPTMPGGGAGARFTGQLSFYGSRTRAWYDSKVVFFFQRTPPVVLGQNAQGTNEHTCVSAHSLCLQAPDAESREHPPTWG